MNDAIVYDIEIFPNCFIIAYQKINENNNNVSLFSIKKEEEQNINKIKELKIIINSLEKRNVTFNGYSYDSYILAFMDAFIDLGLNLKIYKFYELSTRIINNFFNFYENENFHIFKGNEINIEKIKQKARFSHNRLNKNNIDLKKITPGFASLKTYGCRIHTNKISDCVFDFNNSISENDIEKAKSYCKNDVLITKNLFYHMKNQINYREKLNSQQLVKTPFIKTSQQIGEIILIDKIFKKTKEQVTINDWKKYIGEKTKKTLIDVSNGFKLNSSSNLVFYNEEIKKLKKEIDGFKFIYKNNKLITPPSMKKNFELHGNLYSLGIGGLHSKIKNIYHDSTLDDSIIGEFDVVSMYPSIILNEKIHPRSINKNIFLKAYEEIYNLRLKYKKQNNDFLSETFKLALNSVYGKFGNPYFVFFDPNSMIDVTINGQLFLLGLIELFGNENIFCISANTDGVLIKYKQKQQETVNEIVKFWSEKTKLKLEFKKYKKVYIHSVNNYIYIKENGDVKRKGIFSFPSIVSNYQYPVCIEAVINFIKTKTPIEKTIKNNKNICNFLAMRKSKYPIYWGNEKKEIGNTVRWYKSIEGKDCYYYEKETGQTGKVAGTSFSIPMMELNKNEISKIDMNFYIKEAYKILKSIGICQTMGEQYELF